MDEARISRTQSKFFLVSSAVLLLVRLVGEKLVGGRTKAAVAAVAVPVVVAVQQEEVELPVQEVLPGREQEELPVQA
jgi:hypothetical protein